MTVNRPIPSFDLTRQHARLAPEMAEAASRVLLSGRMILGPEVHALEEEVARLCGAHRAVGVANGTDGLYLALRALGIGPGDDVVTTSFSFVATATSIVRAGARPVFADVDPETLNVTADGIERALTPSTRAVVVVHLYGNPAPMDAILDLAGRRGLRVVEDMAQAIGAAYRGRPVGSFGDAAVISFYPTKNLGGCGDGGMVLTRSADLAERVRMLRESGQRRRYVCEDALGINSRLDELQAALLRVKLRHLPEWTERRRRIARRYAEALSGLPARPVAETAGGECVYHQFTIRTPQRDQLAAHLTQDGIGTTVYYPVPLHAQPGLAATGLAPVRPEQAERAAGEVLSLPMFPELEEEEIDRVVQGIRRFFTGAARRAG